MQVGIGFDTAEELSKFDEGLFLTTQSFIDGVVPSNIVAAIEDEDIQAQYEHISRPIEETRTAPQQFVCKAEE